MLWLQNRSTPNRLLREHVAPCSCQPAECSLQNLCRSRYDSQRYTMLHMQSMQKKEYGHKKFDTNALCNSKRRERTAELLCNQCQTENARSAVASNTRQTRHLTILRQTDAWKCTRKQIPRRQKEEHALDRQVHTERCVLHPTSLGEAKRWDGKNKGITLDDLRFLHDKQSIFNRRRHAIIVFSG